MSGILGFVIFAGILAVGAFLVFVTWKNLTRKDRQETHERIHRDRLV